MAVITNIGRNRVIMYYYVQTTCQALGEEISHPADVACEPQPSFYTGFFSIRIFLGLLVFVDHD